MVSRKQVGERLTKKRKERGLSQFDVCKHINVSRNSLAGWEAGVVSPSFSNIVKLADLYGCSIDELAGRKQ